MVLCLAATLLVGCSNKPATNGTTSAPETSKPEETIAPAETSQPEETAAPAEVNASEETAAVKTGLSMVASVSSSKNAGAEEEGLAQTNVALVAVNVGDDGVIDSCVIDMIQAKIKFGADGVITTDLATEFPSKNELGDGYGMRKASGIGKEWNEQAAALAAYVVGKTVDEVKGIAMDEKGKAADADLAASVTVSIGDYLAGIADAVNKAEHRGAQKGDALKIGSVTTMAKSKNASAEGDGLAQAYANVAVVTLRDNTVTSCYIDAVQANVNFNTKGEITSDLNAAIKTKNALGDDYGMRKASSIGKEWYEQAASFCQFVTGKTVSEVAAIAVDENGHTTDVDLAASCTVGVTEFMEMIAKAAKEETAAPAEVNASEETAAVKTGLSMVASVSSSKNAGAEEEGLAQTNVALVAVNVGDDGVIDSCVIDMIQAKIKFGADGVITTDLATEFPSKNELGDGYGMRKASGIGKEWNEQAAALAAYVVGKTVDEVKGIAMDEKGKAADADLAASVTVSIGDYLAGIADAVNKAEHRGAQKGDALKIGSVTTMAKSKNASAEGDGLAQAYANVAVVTLRDNTVTSCYIDAVQANVNFNTKGEITSDLNAAIKTKNALGDDYGMRKASSIGKEWYEQAASFCQFVTGKTVSEVAAIAVDENGHTTDVDLAASCTVGVTEFMEMIAKAAQ